MRFKNLLCIVLTLVFLSGVSVVLADPWPMEEEELRTTIFYRGQEYLPENLTEDQMKEALGWYMGPNNGMSPFVVPENANPLRSDRANQPSFMVDNYGTDIANRIDALRTRVVGDVQGAVKINGYVTYNDNGGTWPAPKVTEMGRYYEAMAKELGLRVRVYTASDPYLAPQSGGDANGIAFIVCEVGPEDARESVMILTHMDTVWDSWRIDYESSNNENALITSTAGKCWNLGGLLSGKEIIEPTTGRPAIVGRGTDDDKVTAIPEMYALKALKDSGVPLKRKVQILLGTNEENGGNRGAQSFTRLETFPKVSYVADVSDGSLRLTQPTFWYARGVLSWDNPRNDDITLRFPAVLPREEFALSNNSTAGGPGTYVRWKAFYDAYHVGSLVGSTQPTGAGSAGWGLQAKTAAWLVCKNAADAGNLYADAIELRKTYIKKYYTYLQNQNYYKPFIVEPTNIDVGPAGSVNPRRNADGTPEAGRWDIGIDVQLVYSPGSDFQDTVQIIARGITWRYTEQFGMNSRQILMDFLANLNIPSGKTARWQNAVKRIAKVFPYGQAEPGKDTWRAAHLFDAVGVQAYFNEFTPSLTTESNLTARRRNLSIAAASWDIDVNSNVASPTRPAARAVTYGGNNDEDVGLLYFELRFLYPMAPFDDDWFKPTSAANNRDYLPSVQAEKVRAAMAAAGIGSTSISGSANTSTTVTTDGITSYNQTSGGSGLGSTTAYAVPNYYASYTHDCVQFALRSTNAYYKANDIPWRETLCGQNGTNYSVVFRIGSSVIDGNANGFNSPPKGGASVGIGHWGGKNGLHAYNERVEIDGLIGFANRVAMVLGDAAQGRPHTYEVSGNGSTNPRMVLRLENMELPTNFNATSTSTYDSLLKEDVYVQETTELPDIMAALTTKGILPTDPEKEIDFLFGRKFLMKGIPADGAFELTVKVGEADDGMMQHLLVVGELADGSGWDVINDNKSDKLETVAKVLSGSKYDKNAASADVVNTRIITFLITEPDDGSGGDGDGDDDKDNCKDKIKDWIDDLCENGCNAGVPMLAVLALAGLMIRRKF